MVPRNIFEPSTQGFQFSDLPELYNNISIAYQFLDLNGHSSITKKVKSGFISILIDILETKEQYLE